MAMMGIGPGDARAASPAGSATAPVVRTTSGKLRGTLAEGLFEFRGIPYAQQPVGALRWRAARPVKGWRGIFDASTFGPVCPQPISPQRDIRAADLGEACLHLNIMTPKLGAAARLPVMVWIHGGANYLGSGRREFEHGSILAREGVVFVSFNYRLGRFAFLSHPALAASHPGESNDNFGLSDQIEALRWLRANVDRFGGDPGNILIFGVSSGGTSVNHLMAAPMARGLFAKAIAQSTGALLNLPRSRSDAEAEGLAFASRMGIAGTGEEAAAALRGLSAEVILQKEPPTVYRASVDGHIVTENMPGAFAGARIANVPYIWGSVSDEGSVYRGASFGHASIENMIGVPVEAFRAAYDPEGGMTGDELTAHVQAGSFGSGEANAAFASRAGRPTWVYRFQYLPASQRGHSPGVPHGGDIPYLFGSMPDPAPEDRTIAGIVRGYWLNFAKFGNPNGQGLPVWPNYRGSSPQTLVIDNPVRSVPDFRARELAVWDRLWADRNAAR